MRVKFDARKTQKPGFKFAEWELKGVPLRLAIGPRDLENNTVEIARRDTLEKESFQLQDIEQKVVNLLERIQKTCSKKHWTLEMRTPLKWIAGKLYRPYRKGGFVMAHWDGTPETEQKIKEEQRPP